MIGIIDVHCHILPGVDDGADTVEEALSMLKREYEDGVRAVILTPHYRRKMFEADWTALEESYKRLCGALSGKNWEMPLYLGCEYHADTDMAEALKRKERPGMAGSRYVLTEFSGKAEITYIRERAGALLSCGFRPVIAHVERCDCLRKKMEQIEELVEMGVRIQVNAGSITGEEGFGTARFCRKLMKRDLLHFVGTDAHGIRRRTPNMGACAVYLEKKMGTEYARKILCENPEKILKEGVNEK